MKTMESMTPKEKSRRTNWQEIIEEVNALMNKLKRKPSSMKIGYLISPGGILNAYREGDLTFKQAVRALEELGKIS